MAQVLRVSSAVGPDQQHIIHFDQESIDTPPRRKGGSRQVIIKAVGGATAKKKPSGGAPRGAMASKALKPVGGPNAKGRK